MPISFTYLRPGKNDGLRHGNLIEIRNTKNGKTVMIVNDHRAGGIRQFDINHVRDYREHA